MPIEVKAKTKAVTFALGDEARVNVGIKGAKGDKGDAFTYDDFTPEQLEALKGKDGYTPVKGIDYFDGNDGKDGYTPIKGVDYFDGKDYVITEADYEAIASLVEVPEGGSAPSGEAGIKIDINAIRIPDKYYSNANGSLVSYNGWDASQLIDVSEYNSISIDNWSAGVYNCWFDVNGNFISTVTFPAKVDIPNNAVYLGLSAATSTYKTATVTGYKESRYATYAELTQVVYRVDNLEEEVGNSSLLLSLI